MRIAQVAPLYESVPPQLYGGTERVVSYLTEALVEMGHEVTLFASGDSVTRAKLVAVCPRSLWRDPDCRETLPHHVRLMNMVFDDASRFDVIHFHTDYLHFPLLRKYRCKSVTTIHGRLHTPDLKSLFDEYAEVPLVSISDNQRLPLPDANWLATVYHGLPRDLHTCQNRPGNYLAFLGRISPEKRLDRAIEIARLSGIRLKVAAKIYPEEREYFAQVIEPLLEQSNSFVEFIGEVGGREKDEFLGGAAALLFPIDWAEPFGLVMIESLACGTPVIAWRNGSVPEIIENGVTGFVVEDMEQAVRGVGRLSGLSRSICRRVFEERFDASRMATDYLEVYRRLKDSQAGSTDQVAHALGTPARGNDAGRSHVRVRPSVSLPHWGTEQTV
jgi:glycosyltransferase involved in cell wall biosynthesis